MKRCENEQCPFRRKHGYPAQYKDDVQTCTDCGAELAEGGVPEPESVDAERTPPHLLRRLASTLGAPAIAWLATRIMLPTVDGQPREQALRLGALENVSIMAPGLMPLGSASQLVELAALAVPRWRPLRIGGAATRAKLWKAPIIVTLVLAVAQALGLSMYLVGLDAYPASLAALHALNVVTLTAGTCLLLGPARRIDRWGLGNGIAVT